MTTPQSVSKPPPRVTARHFWRGAVANWCKWDVALLALVVISSVAWIILNIRPIEYGDPVTHWARLNSVLAGDSVNVRNHHEARFGIEIPAFLARLLLGNHPNVYYVAPLTMFAVLAGATYMLGSRIFDRRVGLIGAGLLALFPQSLRSASQLLPGGFEATFAVLAAYCVLTIAKLDRVWPRLIVGALFIFLGYLAKVQALFYLPGLIMAIWLCVRRRTAVIAFGATVISLVGLEALVYLVAPWDAATRLDAITASAPFRAEAQSIWLPDLDSPLGLLGRYTKLPNYWLWAFIAVTVGAILTWRFLSTRAKGFLAIPASFVVLLTVGVASLHPLRPLVGFEDRFLTSVIPFLLLFLVYLVLSAGDSVGRVLRERSKSIATMAAIAVSLVPILWFVGEMDPVSAGSRNTTRSHPLTLNAVTQDAVSDALATQRAVVMSFDLAERTNDEVLGNAKRLRYAAVFHFPIDSPYRATCLINGAMQLIVIAPSNTFEDRSESLSAVSQHGDVVLISSEPEDPWWLYRVSSVPADELPGLKQLDSLTDTITIREAATQGAVRSLCPPDP